VIFNGKKHDPKQYMSEDEIIFERWIYPPGLDEFHVCIMSTCNDMNSSWMWNDPTNF